jgi:hypothetical protein
MSGVSSCRHPAAGIQGIGCKFRGLFRADSIDRRVDVDGLQCGEQVSLLVVKRGEERLASQRADIVLVLSRPIHLSRRQRGIVDTAHTDDVPQLLAKRREAVANPMRCRCAARLGRRIGRKVTLVLGDCTYEIGGQAMEHLAIPYKVIDRHDVILAARFTTGC